MCFQMIIYCCYQFPLHSICNNINGQSFVCGLARLTIHITIIEYTTNYAFSFSHACATLLLIYTYVYKLGHIIGLFVSILSLQQYRYLKFPTLYITHILSRHLLTHTPISINGYTFHQRKIAFYGSALFMFGQWLICDQKLCFSITCENKNGKK